MTASHIHGDKMVKLPESDCAMTTVGRVEEEPMLKGEKENTEIRQLRLPLLHDRKSLNLWFWNKDSAHHKSANQVLSDMTSNCTKIETVDVGADLWDNMTETEAYWVLQTIGSFTNLKWLHFSLSCPCRSIDQKVRSLSIKMLSHILSNVKGLEFLLLKDVHFAGSISDWRELAIVLEAHRSLLHLSLDNFTFEDPLIDLESFVLALSHIPSLRLVEIFHHKRQEGNGDSLSSFALKTLLKGAHALQVLRLCDLDIGDEQIMEISSLLEANQTLRELWLWQTRVTEKGILNLSGALLKNTSIAVLNLNDNDLASQAGEALFDCFHKQSNSCSVEELYIGCQEMHRSCRRSLLNMIKDNKAIRKLEVCFNWPNDTPSFEMAQFQADLEEAMRSQTILEYLRLYSEPADNSMHSTTPQLKFEMILWNPNCDDTCMDDIDRNDDLPKDKKNVGFGETDAPQAATSSCLLKRNHG